MRAGRAFPVPWRQPRFPGYLYTHVISALNLGAVSTAGFSGSVLQLLVVSVAPAAGQTSEGFAYPSGIGLYGIGSLLTYSTPEAASGGLTQSVAQNPGSDSYGNDYPAGMMTFRVTLTDTAAAPETPSSGCILYYDSGKLYALGPSGTPVLLATT